MKGDSPLPVIPQAARLVNVHGRSSGLSLLRCAFPKNPSVSDDGKWRSAQNSLSCRGRGGLHPFSGWGDRKGPPCIAAKKRTHSYGYSRSLALRSLLAPRRPPAEGGNGGEPWLQGQNCEKNIKPGNLYAHFFQKRDIRTGIAAQIFQTTLRIIGTSMNAGQKDFRIFARVLAHVAEYCKN